MRRLRAIVFDCSSPATVARFWAEALGYSVRPYDDEDIARLHAMGIDDVDDDPSVALEPPDGEGPTLWFNRVPEPKSTKNRVHVDVNAVNAEEVARLVALGATVLRPLGEVPDEPWVVMADPEGNEFCVFPLNRRGPDFSTGGAGRGRKPSTGRSG